MAARKYWQPKESFDWTTGGRALSDEELQILRREFVKVRNFYGPSAEYKAALKADENTVHLPA